MLNLKGAGLNKFVDDHDYAQDIIPGEMIDEESKQRIMNELFNEETQQDTTLEDELAGAHNEEHYNQVLLSHGLPAPPLHFHSENEQYYEKGEMVTNDTLDANLPKQS